MNDVTWRHFTPHSLQKIKKKRQIIAAITLNQQNVTQKPFSAPMEIEGTPAGGEKANFPLVLPDLEQ